MTWMTVMPPYYIKVWNRDDGYREGILNNDFRFRLAGEINYLDMKAPVEVSGAGGVWWMELRDWVKLAVPRREYDKKFLEELYDGENLHLRERVAARNKEERVRNS